MRTLAAGCLIALFSVPTAAAADCGNECDRTLSPYFFIPDGDPEVDLMPLESTSAEVRIAAVFAQVTVRQVYKNVGDRTLEAVYVFPASTRAAVHGMKMKIGERTIAAEIREREQARREYEQARDEGRSAALLEQNRPNVFQMNVANILPGDRIEVELVYSELLEPTSGVYEFVYPTVVGPRYSTTPQTAAASREGWVGNPYLREGETPSYRFDLSAEVAGGVPIRNIECPSHKVDLRFDGPARATLRLHPSENQGGDRDFILRYRLTGDRIASGLLVEEGAEENFFLLMLQPPQRVQHATVPPREYIFVVDVSGSMSGFPYETSKELLRKLIGDLGPGDFFNILFFSGGSFLLSEASLPANASNLSFALEAIESHQPGGGTNLLPALRQALALPNFEETVSRSVLILTDGYVNVEREVFQLIRDNLNQANVFAFGIGSSVNRYLIEGMSRAGWGQPFVASDEAGARSEAGRFRQYVSDPLLTDVQPVFAGFEAYDLEPPQVPDLFAERPIVMLGKYPPSSRGGSGKIVMEGLSARGLWSRTSPTQSALRVPEGLLSRLWARQRLALLADYGNLEDPKTRRLVTELGLRHKILTAFTSFVAVDSVVRAEAGETVRAVQPLPLPHGVSGSAVAASIVTRSGSRVYRVGASAALPAAGPGVGRGVAGGVPGGIVGGVPAGVVGGVPGGVVGGVSAASPPGLRPPPSSAAEAGGRIRVGGSVAAARLQHRVEPEYPELAKKARVQGIVLLQLEIDAKGNVEGVKLIRGHPLLNDAAIEAVKQWKYDPFILNGQPVPILTVATVRFQLE